MMENAEFSSCRSFVYSKPLSSTVSMKFCGSCRRYASGRRWKKVSFKKTMWEKRPLTYNKADNHADKKEEDDAGHEDALVGATAGWSGRGSSRRPRGPALILLHVHVRSQHRPHSSQSALPAIITPERLNSEEGLLLQHDGDAGLNGQVHPGKWSHFVPLLWLFWFEEKNDLTRSVFYFERKLIRIK